MADWVQQDGEWDCCNCGVVFPDGKPKGYDFDRNAVKDLPPNLSLSGRSGNTATAAGRHGRRAMQRL
jgi:hypothetical protein